MYAKYSNRDQSGDQKAIRGWMILFSILWSMDNLHREDRKTADDVCTLETDFLIYLISSLTVVVKSI